MSPNGGKEPTGKVGELIKRDFGSFAAFKDEFTKAAVGHFGSGWAWLILDAAQKLKIISTHDAVNPVKGKILFLIKKGNLGKPILCCDVWEHSYYLDYQNARATYVNAWWNVINWEFANKNL